MQLMRHYYISVINQIFIDQVNLPAYVFQLGTHVESNLLHLLSMVRNAIICSS